MLTPFFKNPNILVAIWASSPKDNLLYSSVTSPQGDGNCCPGLAVTLVLPGLIEDSGIWI